MFSLVNSLLLGTSDLYVEGLHLPITSYSFVLKHKKIRLLSETRVFISFSGSMEIPGTHGIIRDSFLSGEGPEEIPRALENTRDFWKHPGPLEKSGTVILDNGLVEIPGTHEICGTQKNFYGT